MKMSNEIDKVASALGKIQAMLPAVGKDSTGYGYTYASLPEVTNKVYPLMVDNGLSMTQLLDESLSGGPAMTTTLFHTSGQWISGTYPLAEAGMKGVNSAQQFGAAITYARRYGLLALLGVPVADDDAACLSKPSGAPSKPAKASSAKPDLSLDERKENVRTAVRAATTEARLDGINAQAKGVDSTDTWAKDLDEMITKAKAALKA